MDPLARPADTTLFMIKHNLKNITREANPHYGAVPMDGDDWTWDAFITGPLGSPYEGGLFKLCIRFPPDFPLRSPIVYFKTRIFHPNISDKGAIAINMLSTGWSPAFTVAHVLQTLWELLKNPKLDEARDDALVKMYNTDYMQYESIAKAFTKLYG